MFCYLMVSAVNDICVIWENRMFPWIFQPANLCISASAEQCFVQPSVSTNLSDVIVHVTIKYNFTEKVL